MRRTPLRIGLLSWLIASATYAAAERLTVVDDAGNPIAGATVLLGFEETAESPLQTTEADGSATVADLKSTLPLTVSAPGYITVTHVQPGDTTIQLVPADPTSLFEVKGTTSGYGRLLSDGRVDFGLVIPALAREDMLSFDVSTIVSPSTDDISIIGNKIQIPSNLTLPEQRETFIFPITLNKPDYRMYVRKPGFYKFATTHGQFPLQRVVNDIRAGKSFFEVVNYFDFKEGAQRDLEIRGNMSGVDLAVNQVPFNSTFTVVAPAYDASVTMMSLGLLEQNGAFMPTDVKHVKSGESLDLKSNPGAGRVANLSILLESGTATRERGLASWLRDWFAPLLGVLAPPAPAAEKPDFNRLSFAFAPSAEGGVAPIFLPLIGKPSLDGQVMTLPMPSAPAGLRPLAMYLSFAEIEDIENGNVKIERRTRIWDVWSDAWSARVELPKIVWTRRPDRRYRWDVLFLARPVNFSGESNVGPRVDLKSITHATRNSLDL